LFSSPTSRVIVHNHEDKRFLESLGVRSAAITVTPGCGVDPEEFPFLETQSARDPPIVLVPARLIAEKGIADAAAASALLRKRRIRHEMWFTSALDPSHPSSLTAAEVAQMRQQNDCLVFTGYQDSLLPLYRDCRIVCLPTRYPEGLPTSLLEAAAVGRAIVATDNVGCREFAHDGRTALVVPPSSPDSLADALERLLKDHQLAESLRRAAHREFLAGFTKSVMVARSVDALRSLGCPISPFTPGDALAWQ
jgi:glycosyltransferase involved in cell wall biosynthesis